MRIPRWTTYPAIALLLAIALIALPSRRHNDGAAQRSREAASKTEAAIDSSLSRQQGERSSLRDFLPDGFVLDGTVDYRGAVQAAIVACSGKTLELPEFPILIGRSPGERYGLIIREGLTITGKPSFPSSRLTSMACSSYVGRGCMISRSRTSP